MGSDLCHFHSMMMSVSCLPEGQALRAPPSCWKRWLLADEHVVACDLDDRLGAGGSVHECVV